MGSLRDDLAESVGECRETHISWVFLGAEDVYKVKKPVSLGFLDFSTPEKRRAACEAEDALNRRLAPDVYRGVAPVARDAAGRHAVGGPGETVDWAVHMRRLADEQRADSLLSRGRLGPAEARWTAELLAEFHARAPCDERTSAFGSLEAVRANAAENFAQSRRFPAAGIPPALLEDVERRQERFLRENADAFESRRRAGRSREGHGDLRLDQIYLEGDRVLVLDCVEFNERFRCGDAAADVAFLSMDLRSRGRPDLAEVFLAAYARASGDYGLYRVVDFYESYRAHVRSKVAAILAGQAGVDAAAKEKARADALRFLLLARDAGRRVPAARVVAVGGLIAAGKSALSGALAEKWAVPVVDSDRIRKRLFGKRPEEPLISEPWSGAYDEQATRRVYAAMREAAGDVMASGRSVILDASFRSREERLGARRLAARFRAPFLFVECRADPAVCRDRLRARAGEPGVSDAREPLWEDFAARWEPADELVPAERLILDTGKPLSEARLADLTQVFSALARRAA